MNKKFSTLLASVLLTSAFSTAAFAAEPNLKEGSFVQLKVAGSTLVGVATDGTLTATAAENAQSAAFSDVNNQLWKVAKVTTHATTGKKTYQFINKETGAYLAVNLKSDHKPAEGSDQVQSTYPAKVNPATNKEWAFDESGNLYAFSNDSTYAFKEKNNELYLVARKGNKAGISSEITTITNLTSLVRELTHTDFNTLMGLRGHNGMLNFNGKDVSDKETNILKNTKWKAIEGSGSDYIYLTNGSTKKGYTNKMEKNDDGYIKIDKKLYLQVDTAVHAGSDYFKLAVDTLGFEKYDEGTGYDAGTFMTQNKEVKAVDKHPFQLAQFAAKYYFANDSIALTAKNLPTKGSSTTSTSSSDASYVGVDDAATSVNAVNDAFASAKANINASVALQEKVTALTSAVNGWDPSESTAEGDEVSFSATNEGLITGLVVYDDLKEEDKVALNSYKDQVTTLKYRAAGYTTTGTVYTDKATASTAVKGLTDKATTATNNAVQKLATAVKAWLDLTAPQKSFAETLFKITGSAGSFAATTEDGVQSGLTLIQNAQSIDVANTEAVTALANYATILGALDYVAGGYSATVGGNTVSGATVAALGLTDVSDVKYFAAAAKSTLANLQNAFNQYVQDNATATAQTVFASTEFSVVDGVVTIGSGTAASNGVIYALTQANTSVTDTKVTALATLLGALKFNPAVEGTSTTTQNKYYYNANNGRFNAVASGQEAQVVLRKLSSATVLTVSNETGLTEIEPKGYILPLIQPYATIGGDAEIAGTNYHFIQVKNVAKNYLRAASLENKYWAIDWRNGRNTTVDEVSEYNPYTQWAFVEGSTGAYSIINRATGETAYSGALYKVADAENTYTNGTDTIKVAAVELPESAVITEGDKKYDVTGYFYAGKDEKLINRLFAINPVSPFMSQLAAQYNKDSLMILGDAADAPVWRLKEVAKSASKGYVIEGTAPLLQTAYQIYTVDADKNEYYLTLDAQNSANANGFILTKKDSKLGDKAAKFSFISMGKDQYVAVATGYDGAAYSFQKKMTINPTPAKPVLEASDVTSERNDLFTFTQVNQNVYRTLVDEDGVLGNAKIYMENEPNRYLYENTANIVANNGKGLNFLGIYNTAELTKNAAMFIDTAYVNREDNLMPQYMLGLNVTTVPAQDAVACTYEHNHYDNAGNKVDAEHCSHATPATFGYKTGRYLVALSDSVPENGSANSPVYYDGKNVRLAFVDAIHYLTQDTVVIKKSKYTGNSKQQVAGKETTWAAKDTLAITGDGLNAATFALKYKDQATKSFYLESKDGKYVRILNGVPVLTASTEDAAVFNIEATTEEATANEAIEAAGVQVIGGQGVVTVQGAAGKVITVANILGQTIANQVAASDNVTIAAPAGVVVVAVDGDATKVVVK